MYVNRGIILFTVTTKLYIYARHHTDKTVIESAWWLANVDTVHLLAYLSMMVRRSVASPILLIQFNSVHPNLFGFLPCPHSNLVLNTILWNYLIIITTHLEIPKQEKRLGLRLGCFLLSSARSMPNFSCFASLKHIPFARLQCRQRPLSRESPFCFSSCKLFQTPAFRCAINFSVNFRGWRTRVMASHWRSWLTVISFTAVTYSRHKLHAMLALFPRCSAQTFSYISSAFSTIVDKLVLKCKLCSDGL